MSGGSFPDSLFARAVLAVGLSNLAYFFVEFEVARRIGSVSLFADGIDFLEDAAVNGLIFLALGWAARSRARVGMTLSALLLLPAIAAFVTAWRKLWDPSPPEPWLLSATGLGALGVNLGCALLLARFRSRADSLARAAFLSARNDAVANVAIVAAGLTTAASASAWPDLVVGVGIAAMNAGAAKEVWEAAREEHAAPSA